MISHLPEAALLEAALQLEDDPQPGEASSLRPEVVAHLASCKRCQKRLRMVREDLSTQLTTLGGRVPLPPAPRQLRDRILAATASPLASESPFAGFERRFALLFALDAETTRAILGDADGELAWQLRLDSGAAFFHFSPGPALLNAAEAGIVRLPSGVSFPLHRHLGDEHALILRGVLREDASGRESYPGDMISMPGGSKHTVTGVSREPCIFAVLLYGGIPLFE